MDQKRGDLLPPQGPARQEWAEVINSRFYSPEGVCGLINARRGETAWFGLEITGDKDVDEYLVALTDSEGRLVDSAHLPRDGEVGDRLQSILESYSLNRWGMLAGRFVLPVAAEAFQLTAPSEDDLVIPPHLISSLTARNRAPVSPPKAKKAAQPVTGDLFGDIDETAV